MFLSTVFLMPSPPPTLCLSIYLSPTVPTRKYPSIHLIYLSISLSICLSTCNYCNLTHHQVVVSSHHESRLFPEQPYHVCLSHPHTLPTHSPTWCLNASHTHCLHQKLSLCWDWLWSKFLWCLMSHVLGQGSKQQPRTIIKCAEEVTCSLCPTFRFLLYILYFAASFYILGWSEHYPGMRKRPRMKRTYEK